MERGLRRRKRHFLFRPVMICWTEGYYNAVEHTRPQRQHLNDAMQKVFLWSTLKTESMWCREKGKVVHYQWISSNSAADQ